MRKKVLRSPQELTTWVHTEKNLLGEFYLGLNNAPLWRDAGGRGIGWNTRRTLDQLERQAQEWETATAQERDVSRVLGQINGQLSCYENGQAIPSSAPVFGEFRRFWESKSDADRLGFMCARLGQPIIDPVEHLVGFIQGTLVETKTLPYAEGDLERVAKAAAACEETEAELTATLYEQRHLATTSKDEWDTLSQSYKDTADAELTARRAETEKFAHSHCDTMAALVEDTASRIKTCETELGDFRKRIETEISLGEPIKYWEGRETSHNRAFWVSLLSFIVVASAFVATLSDQGRKLMDEIERHQMALSKEARLAISPPVSQSPATATSATGNNAATETLGSVAPYHFVRLGILALASTMAIWFLRFIARIILSSLHLRDDAAERVVMIKTFLALNESKVGLEHEDVKLALASVFRPATSGLVKDDGVPPGVWDAITRLKG